MVITAGRITALAIGLPLALALGVTGAFNVAGTFSQTSEHHAVSYAWHGGPISVTSGSGDVRIVGGAAGRIEVAYTEHYNLRRPTVSATVAGNGVQLSSHCPGGLFGSNCYVNYVVTVPTSAALTVHTGDGHVDASAMSGPLTLNTSNGSINLNGLSGAVVANTTNGDVSGSQLNSRDVQASTTDGSIDIAFATRPHAVSAHTDNGDVDLTVPNDALAYHTSAETSTGSVSVTVATSSTAADTLTARTVNGDVTIGYPAG